MSGRGQTTSPWTSSKKRKMRRKTGTITMSEETKYGLADSDKVPSYQLTIFPTVPIRMEMSLWDIAGRKLTPESRTEL